MMPTERCTGAKCRRSFLKKMCILETLKMMGNVRDLVAGQRFDQFQKLACLSARGMNGL